MVTNELLLVSVTFLVFQEHWILLQKTNARMSAEKTQMEQEQASPGHVWMKVESTAKLCNLHQHACF